MEKRTLRIRWVWAESPPRIRAVGFRGASASSSTEYFGAGRIFDRSVARDVMVNGCCGGNSDGGWEAVEI
jgi:hypothetical protein